MNTISKEAYTYLGVLDDAVSRYPWQFRLTGKTLDYLLAVELIHGKPVLLNDGYLVNNEIARTALMQHDGLLWELIERGFLRIMARGGSQYGLHEMPLRMAPTIPTFRDLVGDRVAGARWSELQPRLKRLDRRLREAEHLIDWPHFDAGSGFLALTQNLVERQATPHALGIGRHVGRCTFESFLKRVVDRLQHDTQGARSTWEVLARQYADDPAHTNRPELFMRALMNLANELYHYNMGIMLTAERDASVSVQTQTSPAFDDLLIPPGLRFLVTELSQLPRLNVPLTVAEADPLRLARILDEDLPVYDARSTWIALRDAWETAEPPARAALDYEVRQAGELYARRLSEHLGAHVRFKETEDLIDYVVGGWTDKLGAAAGLLVGGIDPTLGAVTFAVGYAVSKAKNRALGSVLRKFRVMALEHTFTLPEPIARHSARAMRAIKRRTVPSTIQITSSVAAAIRPRLKPFAR